jgi:hypothetical protein
MKHTLIALLVLGSAAQAAAQSTGYPACDRYISMVTECIKTKMPSSERADAQGQLDAFRGALGFITGDRATKACEENMRLEMQRDKYGCYAARAAAAGVKTACSLLTPSDLQEVFGTAYSAGQPANYACLYASPQSPERQARLEVAWNDGRGEMEAWRGGVDQVKRDMPKRTGQQAPVGAETVAGVGDDAFFVVAGFTPMMAARKGDVALSVRVQGASRDQLIAIVRKALARLP